MKNYILFGAPGAGKGTQSALISKKYNFRHISTGDLLRREMSNGTEIGLMAKKIIESGNLVDDSVVLEILKSELESAKDVNGFIFDGYPRTIKQAGDLDNLLKSMGRSVNAVICLNIDDELIFKRIQGRAMIEGRKDDANEDIIRQRIANFHTQTEPIVDFYKAQGKYFKINGNTSIEAGFESICEIIDKK